MRCLPIQPTVLVIPQEAVVFQNVQHSRHLAEYKYTRTLGLQLGQQLVKQHHFATVIYEVLVCRVGGSRLRPVKQVRVIAALPQLHQDVQQTHLVSLA